MFEPLVSIIIPVHNGSDYMQEAIDSALSQTYKNIEIIVINDGSNDDGATERIAQSYGSRIRYISKKNGGVSSALNVGIQRMQGEYFSWLSHDDIYEPDKIQKQVEALRRMDSPEGIIVYCNYLHIDEDSNLLSKRTPSSIFKTDEVCDSQLVLEKLLKKTTLNGCCLLIPKVVFDECGGFDEGLRFCQDALMWYQIFIKAYSLIYVNEPLVKNRIHAKQLTQTGQALFRKECRRISNILTDELAAMSTAQHNYLKLYLFSDARFFDFRRVNRIISIGKKGRLLSLLDIATVYIICCYGHVRPLIRKLYYGLFRKR